jgi:hypothetical protein
MFVAALAGSSSRAAVILDSLIVRVYDNAGVLADNRTRAMKDARTILARADVDIYWRDCPARGRTHAACATTPAPGELVVRLVKSPKEDTDTRALGSALIDSITGSGTLATVFIDRIQAVAVLGKVDPWPIVGRVMAHEIGHLLLGTNSHSESGLMREIWSMKDLTRNRPGDWLFSSPQREDLRNSRASRGARSVG